MLSLRLGILLTITLGLCFGCQPAAQDRSLDARASGAGAPEAPPPGTSTARRLGPRGSLQSVAPTQTRKPRRVVRAGGSCDLPAAMEPSKLTVPALKAELARRGLDASGLKAALVARLEAAIVQTKSRRTSVLTRAMKPQAKIQMIARQLETLRPGRRFLERRAAAKAETVQPLIPEGTLSQGLRV